MSYKRDRWFESGSLQRRVGNEISFLHRCGARTGELIGGAGIALRDVEQYFIERSLQHKFSAAVALYPHCGGITGPMTVPTLILIGELDDWVSPKLCQDLAAGNPAGTRPGSQAQNIRLTLLPGAYHAFDNTSFRAGQQYLGHGSNITKKRQNERQRRFGIFSIKCDKGATN